MTKEQFEKDVVIENRIQKLAKRHLTESGEWVTRYETISTDDHCQESLALTSNNKRKSPEPSEPALPPTFTDPIKKRLTLLPPPTEMMQPAPQEAIIDLTKLRKNFGFNF